MERNISIDIKEEPPWTLVYYSGPIDLSSEDYLQKLQDLSGKKIVLNLKGVNFINSNGVRCWILFLQNFVKNRAVRIDECSPAVVEQMTMIPSFYQSCEVKSVYGVFECFDCGLAEEHLIKLTKPIELGPPKSCVRCQKALEMDECTEDFLQFFNPLQVG